MSRLFIELYLDEDVDVLVAALLRAQGFSAVTAQAAGRKGEDDDEQLAYAVSQHQTLLTHNRDHFVALAQSYFTAGAKHYGLIIAVRRPPYEIVRRLIPFSISGRRMRWKIKCATSEGWRRTQLRENSRQEFAL